MPHHFVFRLSTGPRMAAAGLLSTPLFGLKEPQMLFFPPPLRAWGGEKKRGPTWEHTHPHHKEGLTRDARGTGRLHEAMTRGQLAAEPGRFQILISGGCVLSPLL